MNQEKFSIKVGLTLISFWKKIYLQSLRRKWNKQNKTLDIFIGVCSFGFFCARISLKHHSTVLQAKSCCLLVGILTPRHTFWGFYHMATPFQAGRDFTSEILTYEFSLGRLFPCDFHFHQELSLRTERPG